MEIHALVPFSSLMLFQVNVVAQKKRKKPLNIGMVELQSETEELGLKKNLEMNFSELQQTKTTN
jgi:hypothetical protein